jgi:hypothetical protein
MIAERCSREGSARAKVRDAAPHVLMFMRRLSCAIVLLCLCAVASAAQHGRLPVPLPKPSPTPARDEPTPTLKKPEHIAALPSHEHRAYDAAHDATYVNVDIPLASHTERTVSANTLAFAGRDLLLTFQLAYRGKRTDDMIAAYLILESTCAPDEACDRLRDARRLELHADGYEYTYERADYKTGTVEQTGAVQKNAPALKREIAIFRLEIEDLTQIAPANRVELKLGAQEFTLKSPQLTDLRRTLATGDKQ